MSKVILTFQLQKEKEEQLLSICKELHIALLKISMNDYAQKLGYLAGIQGFKRAKAVYCGGAFPKEMLIFSGLNSNEVDTFLAEYKKTGLSPIDLKAIVTQHNVFWTPETLFRELMKEHFAFH